MSARARLRAVLGERAVAPELRGDRWLALGPDYVAFVACDEPAWRRLEAEEGLLDAWREAGLPFPRILIADAAQWVQVRERMEGPVHGDAVRDRIFGVGEPGGPESADALTNRYAPDVPLTPFGARCAASYGTLAARIHGAAPAASALGAAIGPCVPKDVEACLALLLERAPELGRRALPALPWLLATPPGDTLVHRDLHFHNMVVDEDGTILGVFDLGDAGVDAAAAEMLYIHGLGPRFVAGVLDAYARERGTPLRLEDVERMHLRTAIAHLDFFAPDHAHHPAILGWIAHALDHLHFVPAG
ncbi:MAG: phosphotransferase [Myxococcota bacterium]